MRTTQAGFRHVAVGWGLDLTSELHALDDVDGVTPIDASLEMKKSSHSPPAPVGRDGDIVSGRFEYERLSPETRAIVDEQGARLDEIERHAAIAKGRVLRAIKVAIVAEIGHGNWLAWLGSRRPKIPETTARCWIRAADWVDKSAIVADMKLGAIYRGARAPAEVKSEIERQLKAGELVNLVRVVELVDLHRRSTSKTSFVGQKKKMRFERSAGDDHTKVEAQHVSDDRPRHLLAREAAQELVKLLRAFFDDDEIVMLNAQWQQAGYIEVERFLRDANGSSDDEG